MQCPKCGSQLQDGAKFCVKCGERVSPADAESTNERKETWAGEINRCPSCGEVLPSFSAFCPACGYELRDVEVAGAVRKFGDALMACSSSSERARVVAAFPVPNAKEDIVEFLILVSTNVAHCGDEDEFDAWCAKFDQCIQKAQLLLGKDRDDRVGELVSSIQSDIDSHMKRARLARAGRFAAKTAGIYVGMAIMIGGAFQELGGENGSLFEFVGMLVLLVSTGVAVLGRLGATGCILGFAGGFFSFGLGNVLESQGSNGSLYQLGGGLIMILSVIGSIKLMAFHSKK